MSIRETSCRRRCCSAPMYEWEDTVRGWVAWCFKCGRVAWWPGGGKIQHKKLEVHLPDLAEALQGLLDAGAPMSNACFNLASRDVLNLTEAGQASMRTMADQWDAARTRIGKVLAGG